MLVKTECNERILKMSTYNECPNCGRKAKKAVSSNYFPVLKCKDCGKLFCTNCGESCPKCGSNKSSEYGKVYA
jgi:ribosomal protein L32